MDNIGQALMDMYTYERQFTEYVGILRENQLRKYPDKLAEFSEVRKIPLEELESSEIFYVGNPAEILIPEYIEQVDSYGLISPTNRMPIFHDRYVIPIKNADGNILNLVGYNAEKNERYVYGTAKYYLRRHTPYGLENLPYAYEQGFAIYTEGITDAIRLRSLGFRNSFANCGTHDSKIIEQQMNRCKYGVIVIPDRDKPGTKAKNKWKFINQIVIYTFIKYKDIDEMCKDNIDDLSWIKSYIDLGIKELKNCGKNGAFGFCKEFTMY